MNKIKLLLSTIFTLTVVFLFVYSINPIEAQASTPYMTVDYKCPNGRTIDRCDYGNGGCDISGQKFCNEVE